MDDWKLETVERAHILRVMELVNWRVKDAAAMLGIGKWALCRRLRKYGVGVKIETTQQTKGVI